ncbi:MAG TPA: helix-turn-helix domain-containing protein [Acidimicrobiales bacterium]
MAHETTERDPANEASDSSIDHIRNLDDPKTLRALTHPVRLALLEALTLEGPLTATAAGELIGESPTTCSFHFRQLAKYGFVEEAGAGPGRQRPWKVVQHGMRFDDLHEDPETSIAAKSLERMVFGRAMNRREEYYNARPRYPREWQEATDDIETILMVTPAELREVLADVMRIFDRFRDRISDPTSRPADTLPVEVLTFAYPIKHPGSSQ